MTLSFDPSTDFEDVVDKLEAITLTAKDDTETSVTSALRRHQTRTEVAGETGGTATEDTAVWHLPLAEVSTMPELGATITDSDDWVWEIIVVERQLFGNRWRCGCRRGAITDSLDTMIDIERASFVKGTHGESKIEWKRSIAGVRASISDAALSVAQLNDARIAKASHQIVLETDETLTPDYRIIGPDGTAYHILQVEQTGVIGNMQTALCTVDLTPFGS